MSWFENLKGAAGAALEKQGLPTRKQESWRNTPIPEVYDRPATGKPETRRLADVGPTRIIFENGKLVEATETPKGVTIVSIQEQIRDLEPHLGRLTDLTQLPYAALNTMDFGDGACVRIARGTVVEEPIHLVFLAAGDKVSTSSRVLVIAEEDCEAKLLEEYSGDGSYFRNAVTEIHVGPNARIDHYKLQRESREATHVAAMTAKQDRNSKFQTHSLSVGAALARNDFRVVLDGEGADCQMNGLYTPAGTQHVDHQTVIDHAKPHTNSRELYKGILGDQSRGVFNGRVIVRRDSQKIDADQENRNLLLSDHAMVNSNPQLEIFADDVKCRHGSTIGQLSKSSMFYLRSRGIDAEEARQVLIYAFASEMVDRIRIEPVRAALRIGLHRDVR